MSSASFKWSRSCQISIGGNSWPMTWYAFSVKKWWWVSPCFLMNRVWSRSQMKLWVFQKNNLKRPGIRAGRSHGYVHFFWPFVPLIPGSFVVGLFPGLDRKRVMTLEDNMATWRSKNCQISLRSVLCLAPVLIFRSLANFASLARMERVQMSVN